VLQATAGPRRSTVCFALSVPSKRLLANSSFYQRSGLAAGRAVFDAYFTAAAFPAPGVLAG
jgi:hypothetical protein